MRLSYALATMSNPSSYPFSSSDLSSWWFFDCWLSINLLCDYVKVRDGFPTFLYQVSFLDITYSKWWRKIKRETTIADKSPMKSDRREQRSGNPGDRGPKYRTKLTFNVKCQGPMNNWFAFLNNSNAGISVFINTMKDSLKCYLDCWTASACLY